LFYYLNCPLISHPWPTERRHPAAMDFTFAVMQMNGDITDRCRRSFHAMHGRESGDRMVQGFHLMLVEYVPEIPTEIVRFRVPLNETLGLELNWHQPDAVSA